MICCAVQTLRKCSEDLFLRGVLMLLKAIVLDRRVCLKVIRLFSIVLVLFGLAWSSITPHHKYQVQKC